jgi:hypothetical protein
LPINSIVPIATLLFITLPKCISMLTSVDYQHIIFSVVLPMRKKNYWKLFSFFIIHNIFTYLKILLMTRTHIHKNKDEEEKRKSRDGWIRRLFVHHPSILPFLLLITLNQSSLILLLSFVNSWQIKPKRLIAHIHI